MTRKDLPPEVAERVPVIAYSVYRTYRKYVDRDELIQEAWIWCLKRRDDIEKALAEPNPDIRKHNESRLWWQLKRSCERYARKEKAIKSGYIVGDEYFFEISTISQMLPHIMANIFEGALLEQAQQIVDDGLPKRPSAPSEGRNLLTMLVDIKKCYELLDEQERELLKARYHDNLTLIQMAEKFETSKSSVDRWCENALRSLQRLLGGDSPWS